MSVNLKRPNIILLVEDNAILMMGTKRRLEDGGYKVMVASRGEEAIEVVKRQKIDLILMDIELGPGLNGIQTAEIILKDWAVPLIFFSSHVDPEIIRRAKALSPSGYVSKSSGDISLLNSIETAFKDAPPGGAGYGPGGEGVG